MLIELGYYYALGFFIIFDIYTAIDPRQYYIHSTNLRQNPKTDSVKLRIFARVKFSHLIFIFAGIFTPITFFAILAFFTFFKTNLSPSEVRNRSIIRLIIYAAAAAYLLIKIY